MGTICCSFWKWFKYLMICHGVILLISLGLFGGAQALRYPSRSSIWSRDEVRVRTGEVRALVDTLYCSFMSIHCFFLYFLRKAIGILLFKFCGKVFHFKVHLCLLFGSKKQSLFADDTLFLH